MAFLAVDAARAQQAQQVLHHHVRSAVSNARAALGSLPTTQRLNFSIMLTLRNVDELDSLLQRLYDPASPDYRHFLTASEFVEQFGPSVTDYQAVIKFARDNGFTVTNTPANRMVVALNGTVEQIQKAFNVSMKLYRDASQNRTFYSPDREPSMALSVPVWHIDGLNNYSEPQPMVSQASPALRALALTSGSGPGGSFLASDMRAAHYGGSALTGAGQAVGLFEALSYDIKDVNLTFASAGQSYSVPINNVLLDGFTNNTGVGDAEPVLDIVQAIGMAPGLSQVRVYSGLNIANILNAMASENIAKQLSISYVWVPEYVAQYEQIFKEYAAQGQTVFAASGDHGAYQSSDNEYYPAEDPYVTAVGGTTLLTNGPGGSWNSETGWLSSGGGYGIGQYGLPIPSWQQGVANLSNGGSTTLRNVPDVAMDGDFNNYSCQAGSCSGYWGGTSFSAPRWAAFMALVNQQAALQSKPALGFINPAIYAIGQGSNYSNDFHDVTVGYNNCCGQTQFYYAVPGYDLVTGWGSPKGQSLINDLAGGYTITASRSTLSVQQGSSVSTTISLAAQGGFSAGVTLAASGLPTGVTASFSTNPITGSGLLILNATAQAAVGSATITVTGTSGGLSQTTSVLLTITAAPPSSQVPPSIGYVAFWGINDSGVTVSWSTDVPATTQLAYGTSTALGQLSALQSSLAASHGVVLTGLKSGTTYYFQPVSTANGATGYSTVYSFTTTGTASTGSTPLISNVTATGVTSGSATITWTTDQPSTSLVNYGTTAGYGLSSPLNAALVTSHSVTINGLQPGTLYAFDVVSINAAGGSTTSNNNFFTTPGLSAKAPYVGYVACWGVNNSGATISWSTDVPASAQLAYGTTPSLGQLTSLQTSLTASHGVVLTGLNSGTTYYFVAQSTDANGVTGYSTTFTFTTSNN